MIEAEEFGLSSHNIDNVKPTLSRVRSFLSIHPDSQIALGAVK
jgi:hypothetical protein